MSSDESLCTQLSELNQRSRMYATQMWQVPFAYLGIVGIALSLTSESASQLIIQRWAGGILCLIGVTIFVFMCGIYKAIGKSVININKIETELSLSETAERYHLAIDFPIFFLVIVGIAVCALVALGCLAS